MINKPMLNKQTTGFCFIPFLRIPWNIPVLILECPNSAGMIRHQNDKNSRPSCQSSFLRSPPDSAGMTGFLQELRGHCKDLPTIPTSQSAPPALPHAQDQPSEAPAAGTKAMPKAKSQQKTPEAGPSTKLAQVKESGNPPNTTVPSIPSKGRKREGDLIEARLKKTRIVSVEYINDSDEEMVKVKSESQTLAGAKSGLQVFVEIPPKPKSKSQPQAKSQPRAKLKSQP